MTISETAIAKTTEPTAALKAEKMTGTEDLIQVNENKEDNSELSIGVPNDINLSNPNLTDSGSYEYKNNGSVDFNADTAFPVLADPNWVAIGACAAALTWFVGSNLFAAAKMIAFVPL